MTATAIIGATAGLGRALALEAAACSTKLYLVASDARDLEAISTHIRLVFGVDVATLAASLTDPDSVQEVIDCLACIEDLQCLLLPVGMALDTDLETIGAEDARHLLEVNLTAVSLVALRALSLMRKQGGSIVGFGSVSAFRGRRRNIFYAAAKRGLTSVFEALQHAAGDSGITVQFYQLGFLKTQNTYGMTTLFPPTDPQRLAKRVFRDMNRPIGIVSFPRYWSLIAIAVRLMPFAVFRRLDI